MKEGQKEVLRKKIIECLSGEQEECSENILFSSVAGSKKDIKNTLREMIYKGEVECNPKSGAIKLKESLRKKLPNPTKEGVIIGNRGGFAFCRVEGEDKDYFISRDNLAGAVNLDRVKILPIKGPANAKQKEAKVKKIIERGNKQIIGIFYEGDGYAIVQPDNDKFSTKIILENSNILAKSGDKVVVKLINQPEYNGAYFTGEVVENLGAADTIEAYILSIVREHNLVEEFPQEVLDYAKKLSAPTQEQIQSRKDFRTIQTFTIDGKDARDLDDAVSMTKLENGNVQLGVHIADVSEYVKPGDPIFEEAVRRATSVYFPAPNNLENSKIRAVIPMLPEIISNYLCSLNPHTDKLTLSCMMELDPSGAIVEGENTYVCESVINTCHRLNYDEVFNVLQGVEEDTKRLEDIKDTLLLMGKYSKLISTRAKEAGRLDLDVPEPKFIFDESAEKDSSRVVAIVDREQNEAHKLIENFMVSANTTIAKTFDSLEIPFIYRIHESPDKKKIAQTLDVIKNCCSKSFDAPEKVNNKFLESILNSSDDQIVNQAINKMVLRAMAKAIYSDNNLGHFGLALKDYTHFTSPIRRLPDLVIHRIIKDYLHQKINQTNISKLEEFVYEMAMRASSGEQNAAKVERKIDDLWCCEFMKDKIGKEFDVVVVDVQNYGVYVCIPNTAIEGLVRLEDMTDKSFIYNDKQRLLVGSSSKFVIGDRIRVKVDSVNMFKREIDFSYIQHLDKQDYAEFRKNNKKIKGVRVDAKVYDGKSYIEGVEQGTNKNEKSPSSGSLAQKSQTSFSSSKEKTK